MERFITQEQTIDAFAQAMKNSLYHRWPGAVVAYHSDSMTADCQPMTNDPRTNPDTGEVFTEPWPIIKNVPIAWPRFGGLVLVGPLKQGDPVVLEAFDIDPTTAFAAGASSSTTPVDPGDIRRHGGGYFSATPTNLTGAIKDASAAAAAFILGLDGDTAQIILAMASLIVGKTGCTVAIAGGAFPLVIGPWATSVASALTTFGNACTAAVTPAPTTLPQAIASIAAIAAAGAALGSAVSGIPQTVTKDTTAT